MRIRFTTVLMSSLALLASAQPEFGFGQGVYKSVDSQGRIRYTDGAQVGQAINGINPPPGRQNDAGNAQLPYAVRQAAQQFPVTFYASNACPPCDQARLMLQRRGIPYTEKQISSVEDLNALQKVASTTGLPVLSIGQHTLKGFSASDWQQHLDLANYPQSSQLPINYQWPAATPLAKSTPTPATNANADGATVSPVQPPLGRPDSPVTPANNPAGIRF